MGTMLGRRMMEDGGRVWSLVPGGEVTEPGVGPRWIKTNKQQTTNGSQNRHEPTMKRERIWSGGSLHPSLDGPETRRADQTKSGRHCCTSSHEEVCAMLLQEEIV